MGQVRFSHAAETDLLEAWLSIAEDNPSAADGVLDAIHETSLLLGDQTKMGRSRPELAVGLRSFPTRTRYVLYYIADGEDVVIVRVLHHARDIDPEYFG